MFASTSVKNILLVALIAHLVMISPCIATIGIEEAYELFVKLQCSDAALFFTKAPEMYQALLQLEECEETDDAISCKDVRNEWWIVNPNFTFNAYTRNQYNGIYFIENETTFYSKEEAITFAKAHNWDGVMDNGTGEIVWENKEETNMNVWYAIANCEEPEGIYKEFWKWDTKYDVGYELSSYDELPPYADKCSTIEGAESRAKDVLSTILDDEVCIVRVYEDEDGDMDYAEFVKIVNRNDKEGK
jgi:hypothetical protein